MKNILKILLTLIICTAVIIPFSSCSDKTSEISVAVIKQDTVPDNLTEDEKNETGEEIIPESYEPDVESDVTTDTDVTPETDVEVETDIEADADVKAETDVEADANNKTEDDEKYNFRILTRSDRLSEQCAEQQTGDIINDAVYKRNEAVKELFNIDITVTESYSDNTAEAINQILSGNDKYDIIFPDANTAFDYAVKSVAVDFNAVSTIDTSSEWWAKDIIDSCTVNGHLYVLDGDISMSRYTELHCILFNKHIFDELGLNYPYETVLDGAWTFDEFTKLSKLATTDLDGNGNIEPSSDILGFYTYNSNAPIYALYSGGQRVYTGSPDGIPSLSVNSAKTVDIFTKLFAFTQSDSAFMHSGKWDTNSEIFSDGRVMFTDIYSLGEVGRLRNMADEFGILPLPKFYAEDSYITPFNDNSSLMIMPITVYDYEATGEIIEAMCRLSSEYVTPAIFDYILKTKFSRDDESEAMLGIVKNSMVYDIGYLTDSVFGHIGEELAGMKNPDYFTYYAQNEASAVSELDDFIKAYGKVG